MIIEEWDKVKSCWTLKKEPPTLCRSVQHTAAISNSPFSLWNEGSGEWVPIQDGILDPPISGKTIRTPDGRIFRFR